MSAKQTQSIRSEGVRKFVIPSVFLLMLLMMLAVFVDMVNHSIAARQAQEAAQQAVEYLTNDGLEEFVIQYFTKYGAAEMIPIIECESHFRHFGDDGSVLKNRQGSSATGIAQIMASVHPDPQVIKRYNRRNYTNYRVEDFDITTLTGNLWYALILYKTNGTRDWECSEHIQI